MRNRLLEELRNFAIKTTPDLLGLSKVAKLVFCKSSKKLLKKLKKYGK